MVNKFLGPVGGAETYMITLGKALEKRGHEVQFSEWTVPTAKWAIKREFTPIISTSETPRHLKNRIFAEIDLFKRGKAQNRRGA